MKPKAQGETNGQTKGHTKGGRACQNLWQSEETSRLSRCPVACTDKKKGAGGRYDQNGSGVEATKIIK